MVRGVVGQPAILLFVSAFCGALGPLGTARTLANNAPPPPPSLWRDEASHRMWHAECLACIQGVGTLLSEGGHRPKAHVLKVRYWKPI